MGLREVVIHAWSWLNYKPIYANDLGMPNRRAFPEAQASWVPAEDEKRLAAYKLLAAYDNNQAAELAAMGGDPDARERREFGDPSTFIDTVMAHVLGREQTITVPGAEHDSDATPTADEAMAARVQELLRKWAKDELLPMRMQQAERKAVSLGDGVYRLAWEPGKMRPTLRVHDPGFYFPVLPEDGDAGEYPTRVHFAWELPEDTKRGLKARIRRITYELDWIRPATASGVDQAGRAVRAPLPVEVPEDAAEGEETPPPLSPGDLYYPATGAIARQYAWNDAPSYVTCYLTDATWELGDIKGPVDVDSLPLGKATFATRGDGEVLDHLDLLIDFMPVVHVPNTVPGAEEHWGQSTLAKILQVFDELAGTDTDSSKASATTGSPFIVIAGGTPGRGASQRVVGPGTVVELPEGGRMDTVNTAPQLAELRNHVHDLQERVAHNARIPAVAMGAGDPSQFASGFALQIALGPLDSLIASMRLARDHKYQLLLKMVQRLFLAGQHPDWAGVTVQPAELAFGAYTPTDKQAVLEQVTAGVDKVFSRQTAVRMLMDAGFPIDDAAEEIERIESRQFEAAKALADATGDSKAVGDFLGLDLNPDPVAPAVILPATGTQGTDPNATVAATDDVEAATTSANTGRGQSGGNTSR
ncbi:hypothetical protein [Streptomyces olivaceiscleroticus]|uniref:Phage portal protein n=1 Tax=Streptomyces olivaceiscleroticus TaxID=68245 RepID=A0ABN1BND6_9ACTN